MYINLLEASGKGMTHNFLFSQCVLDATTLCTVINNALQF